MIADGIGTMIASFFGSPFGTVVYIGHPAYKRSELLFWCCSCPCESLVKPEFILVAVPYLSTLLSILGGALVGYSLTNGIVYLFLSWFGILALVQSIVNQATIGPIVLFV